RTREMRSSIQILTVISVAVLFGCGGGNGSTTGGIENLADEGRSVVPPNVQPLYGTDPPTSGPHYSTPVAPGVYNVVQAAGGLVEALLHSNVVIYVDMARASQSVKDALTALANAHTDPYAGVIVVPRTDANFLVIATAWDHRLRLTSYDAAKIAAFLTQFLG